VHHATDEAIDVLYAWMPPQTAPQACPEAALSLTLKGLVDGHEALLTIRGQTAEEFTRNLAHVRGLLDAPPVPPATSRRESGPVQEVGWCQKHGVEMTLNQKEGRSWWSHKTPDGRWCKGR
jgi:hypothetical protein